MIVVPIVFTVVPTKWLLAIAAFCVIFNTATIAECVYSLVENRDFSITLKPFPTYSKAIDVTTTRAFAVAYIVISALAVGADLVLLLTVKSNPYKALRTFVYWNAFHFAADFVIMGVFFIAVLTKYDANEAFRASPPFMFVATALRISILGSVYHTYKVYSPDSSSSNEAPLVHVRPLPSVSKAN
ncbi:uncharacterized protein LOC144122959 [Amblyomma americanum]